MFTKTFDIVPEIIMEYQILTLPHFELLGMYLDMFDENWSFLNKNWSFLDKSYDFDQSYVNTGSKTQNVEELCRPRSDIPQWFLVKYQKF